MPAGSPDNVTTHSEAVLSPLERPVAAPNDAARRTTLAEAAGLGRKPQPILAKKAPDGESRRLKASKPLEHLASEHVSEAH